MVNFNKRLMTDTTTERRLGLRNVFYALAEWHPLTPANYRASCAGHSTCLFLSIANALTTRLCVTRGTFTSSIRPRAAATPLLRPALSIRHLTARRLIEASKLLGEHSTQQRFHFRNIYSACAPRSVGRVQRLEIGRAIVNDLVGDGRRAGRNSARPDRQDHIGKDARCPAIAVGERMNPIEPPHDISGKVKRRARSPTGR